MDEPHFDVGALYAALDALRESRGLTWRKLAADAGVAPSTLSRMSNGKSPDVDSFAKLIHWLHIPAERFLRAPDEPRRKKKETEPVAMVSAYLRASKNLSPESIKFLEAVFQAAYEKVKADEKAK